MDEPNRTLTHLEFSTTTVVPTLRMPFLSSAELRLNVFILSVVKGSEAASHVSPSKFMRFAFMQAYC